MITCLVILALLILYEIWDRYSFNKKLKRDAELIRAQAAENLRRKEEERRRALDEKRLLEQQKINEAAEKQSKETVIEETQQDTTIKKTTNQRTERPQSIESYFNGYNDLRRIILLGQYWLVPLHKQTMEEDVNRIAVLYGDSSTKKCMPSFCDSNNRQFIKMYLQNTYQCTEMGIAFGYAIREVKSFNPMRMEYGSLLGFIKVTSPSHNKVTNNFDGWLIDYVMLPENRNKGLMKISIARVLEKLKDFEVTQIYAMVDNDNISSLKVLIGNGFKVAYAKAGNNPFTGVPYSILVRKLS